MEITRGKLIQFLEREDGDSALEELISRELIKSKAKERGLTATDDEINRRMAIRADSSLMKTGVPFEQWLKDSGRTLDDYRETERMQILSAKLAIPESVEKSFFEKNKDQLKDPRANMPWNSEAVIYRQIVVASKAEAEAIAKQVDAAKDKDAAFAQVAKDKSLDPMTRARGGMLEPHAQGTDHAGGKGDWRKPCSRWRRARRPRRSLTNRRAPVLRRRHLPSGRWRSWSSAIRRMRLGWKTMRM